MKIICLLALLLLFFLGLLAEPAIACTCNMKAPPCYEYWRTDAVFVGTVKTVSPDPSFVHDKVEIAIDENFRGMEASFAETFNFGHSCAFTYATGEKYLFYAGVGKEAPTQFGTSFCDRTALFSENLIDLEFLRSIRSDQPIYWIWGTISGGMSDLPFKGVKAEVISDSGRQTAISDNGGNLKIVVRKAGKYRVRVYLPKGKTLSGLLRNDVPYDVQINSVKSRKLSGKTRYVDYEVDVQPNRCGWFDLSLHNEF